jgi:N-methylhydantoinase B/oxoprolinase/acetone carboxylase alpha subunit
MIYATREIYEEGIQIPPMMLFREGRPNEDLLALFAENVRNPNQVLGDLHALVAANEIGTRRLVEFMAEYGLGDLAALAEIVQGKAESAMRAALRFAARACRSTCSPRAHMTVNLDRLIFFDCFSKTGTSPAPWPANPLDPRRRPRIG